MNHKRNTDRLAAVTFTYVGTDQEFDEFLKMLIQEKICQGGISPSETPP